MEWRDEQLVPISALQHFVYCPRQCALIHVEQVWDENIYTMRGRRAHERVDSSEAEWRDGERREFALPIWSDRLGLIGRADVVVFEDGGAIYPVEHKIGVRKESRADEIQLCAQAICLEQMFNRSIPQGSIYYVRSRHRRVVRFGPELRREVEHITLLTRTLLDNRTLPEPVADSRCERCSLLESCMPFAHKSITNDADKELL